MYQTIKNTTSEVLQALLPIILIIVILQFTVLHVPLPMFLRFLVGAAMAIVGVIFFLLGVRTGILPMGQRGLFRQSPFVAFYLSHR